VTIVKVLNLVAITPIVAVAGGIVLAPIWYIGVGWQLRRPDPARSQ
jgi:hypothetical protein